MKQNTSLKIILLFFGAALTIVLTMLAFVPLLNEVLKVEAVQSGAVTVTPASLPDTPEQVAVTAIYHMEETSQKISSIYIEVLHAEGGAVAFFEVPVDTKVNLSEALYKSLQTYAPELPQYLKLSHMAESFSMEYSLTGCNRILSEVLGISINAYVRAGGNSLTDWFELLQGENSAGNFFDSYAAWLYNSSSSRTIEERWTYYESYQKVTCVVEETAPGSREKDGYLLSGKRSKERLQELMLRVEPEE